MAETNTISYDTQNLENRGVEYDALGKKLDLLLSKFDGTMHDELEKGLAGRANPEIMSQYMRAREEMEYYPTKIKQVGASLIEAARTGKAIDDSLVGDVSLNIM